MDIQKEIYPYNRLLYPWSMIRCLWDFINCIRLNKKDLKDLENVQLIEVYGEEFNPGGLLKDYIYLEANSFFQYAKHLKEKGDQNLPELPKYIDKLRDFRNAIVGHRDNQENLAFPDGWMRLNEDMNKIISAEQLVKDVDSFYQEVKKRQTESNIKKMRGI